MLEAFYDTRSAVPAIHMQNGISVNIRTITSNSRNNVIKVSGQTREIYSIIRKKGVVTRNKSIRKDAGNS